MPVGSDRGLIHFSGLGFSTAYKYVRKRCTANDCIQLRIFTPGACSNTDPLPAMLLRILLKVNENNFIKQRTKYDQPEPKSNRKLFMVVTNVCELLIYACESKDYCGELLKLSTEHIK